MPQPGSWQQSGLNDIQMYQQQIMLKQLQELQRQQQIPQLGDVRQQNPVNHLSELTQQTSGGQFPNLINGTPVHDTSQMYMNWVKHGSSPALQGVPKGLMFSQEQGQTLVSVGQVPQQHDVSLYGTPVANARGNLNQYSHLQGVTNDHANFLTKAAGDQAQKNMMHSSAFNTSFLGDKYGASPDQVCMPNGAFISKQEFSRKNSFGQVPMQGLDNGNLLENFQQVNNHKNASVQEFNVRQEKTGWPGNSQDKATQISPSQSSATLDPLEEKILFGMNDNTWDASFGGRTELGTGSFGNALEHADFLNASPSLQSGSWSALMQSAVAEASSSDTGLQEEWSGLTFQNMELSADNQPSNFVDSGKQHAGCVDSNLHSASSLSSKPFAMDSNPSIRFPGFQPPGFQFSSGRKEGIPQDSSHESIQRSPKNSGNWLDCNPQETSTVERSKQVQPLAHLENAWNGQTYEHSDTDAHQQSFNAIRKSRTTKSTQETNRQVPDNNHLDYMRSVDNTTRRMGNESMVNHNHGLSNGPPVMDKSYNGAGEAYEKQQNFYQRENSNDRHQSIAFQHAITGRDGRDNLQSHARDSQPVASSHRDSLEQGSQGLNHCEQGFFGQFNVTGNVSNSVMDLEKGHLPEFQGNSRVSEDILSRGNLGSKVSASFDPSVGFYGPNSTPQRRQNMHELHQKVDHGREDPSATRFGSMESNPLSQVSKTETPDAYVAQLYNQSAASQGFGLRLAPPCERVPNSNLLLSSQSSPQTMSNLNARHLNQDFGQREQTWFTPPSAHFLTPSHDSSGREHLDGKFSSSGQPGIETSHLNMQGTSPAAMSQIQRQHISNAPIAFQSSQETLPQTASRLPPFNLGPTQDNLRHCINSFGQQFPVLEAVPVTQSSVMSGMSQQGEVSIKSQNVWTNIPIRQHSSDAESPKVFSAHPSNYSLETTSMTSQEPNDQNSQHGGIKLSESGSCSTHQQGVERTQGKRFQSQISSEILDQAPQTSNLLQGQQSIVEHLQNAGASGSSVALLHPHDINRLWQGDNQARAASMRNLQAIGHSVKPSHIVNQNHSLLQQVQAMSNVETGPVVSTQNNGVDSNLDVRKVHSMTGQQLSYEHNTRVRNLMDIEPNATPQLSSSGNTNILSFLSEARENNSAKALSPQSNLQDIRSPFSNGNVVPGRTGNPQISLQMANSWFQHYGNFKNGQILSLSDPRTAKAVAEKFPFGNPSHNLHTHTSSEQVNAAIASQMGSVLPSAATMIASEPLPTPYVLSSDKLDRNLVVTRPKKRKLATSELLPWHKEVTSSSERLQDISMAELEWAQASNRLTEKVDNEAALIEAGPPLLRPKRRLILTTQLMQQLLRPPPEAILSADAASGFDSAYFVAKVALGDACSLASLITSDYRVPQGNSSMLPEKLTTSERVGDQYFSKIMEDFTDRTKKLENDLLRLDKKVSIVDLKLECQELEKFAIINRFAKFHIRGQADAAETSTGSGTIAAAPKICPQRYITASPMPRILPEDLHCLSL